MAAFITPELDGERQVDLREVYFREARSLFILAGTLQHAVDLAGHAALSY